MDRPIPISSQKDNSISSVIPIFFPPTRSCCRHQTDRRAPHLPAKERPHQYVRPDDGQHRLRGRLHPQSGDHIQRGFPVKPPSLLAPLEMKTKRALLAQGSSSPRFSNRRGFIVTVSSEGFSAQVLF